MSRCTVHSFPSFYACYLLKSVQTPRSYRNYIGSTQNPVRRLRQHNGFIAQGARRTAAYRPWAMQLLVHGFPSKPAALSFEWAWQNPERSRYLRDNAGKPLFEKRARRLDQNIAVLQRMICTHPFSTWPLHVKLFTEEAVRCWNILTAGANETEKYRIQLFPPGFTCSVELEGVDGSSGVNGSGRQGSVYITDEHFTSAYLAKHTALIASNHPCSCSVCKSPIHDFPSNHLGTALCPTTGCITTSHLTCLAKSWLDAERPEPITSKTVPNSNPFGLGSGMLPRGGTCTSCGSYTLWGDIVRGCYRRYSGPAALERVDPELEEAEQFEVPSTSDSGLEKEMEILKLGMHTDNDNHPSARKSKGTGFLAPLSCGRSGKLVSETTAQDAIRYPVSPSPLPTTSTSAPQEKRKRGRPRKFVQDGCELGVVLPTLEPSRSATNKRGRPRKIPLGEVIPPSIITKKRGRPKITCSKDIFRMVSLSSISTQTSPVPRKRGRPRKMSLAAGLVARPEQELEFSIIKKETKERQAVGVVLEARKRGRPRKTNAELCCRQAVLEEPASLRPVVMPRKRGRPKKITTVSMVLAAAKDR